MAFDVSTYVLPGNATSACIYDVHTGRVWSESLCIHMAFDVSTSVPLGHATSTCISDVHTGRDACAHTVLDTLSYILWGKMHHERSCRGYPIAFVLARVITTHSRTNNHGCWASWSQPPWLHVALAQHDRNLFEFIWLSMLHPHIHEHITTTVAHHHQNPYEFIYPIAYLRPSKHKLSTSNKHAQASKWNSIRAKRILFSKQATASKHKQASKISLARSAQQELLRLPPRASRLSALL